MENCECPHCCEQTIRPTQKIMAGKWVTILCPDCQGRMCTNPIILALLYFMLTWNIFFFGYMAIRESSIGYAVMMVVGWAIIEFFIYYIPLSRMRALKPKSTENQNREPQDPNNG